MRKWPWLVLVALSVQALSVVAEEALMPDPNWKVARAQFATSIKNREPVDQVVLAAPPVTELYFFTDLRHLDGRTVTHRWEYEGQLISVVPFVVQGPRWRVFSMKEIEPEQIGEWSVTVVDQSGWPLHTELFRYQAADVTRAPQKAAENAGIGAEQGVGLDVAAPVEDIPEAEQALPTDAIPETGSPLSGDTDMPSE